MILRYLNFKEKIDSMRNVPVEAVDEMPFATDDEMVVENKGTYIGYRHDLRKDVERLMKEHNIPMAQVAKRIGMFRQNFNAYMKGRIGLPYEQVERLLWLLDDKSAWWKD